MKTLLFTTLALVISSFFLAPAVFAQSEPPCGNIITPANVYYEGSEEFSDPIPDCSNPFGRTGDLTTFKLNNQIISNNSTIDVSESGTDRYGFDGETYYNRSGADYYLHSGNDYIRVNTNFVEPVNAQFEAEITNFFNGNPIQVNYYTEIYLSSDQSSYFLISPSPREYRFDQVEPSKRVVDIYNEMTQYIIKNAKSDRPALVPGTYTVVLVDTDEGPNQTFENNLFQKVFAAFVPTALAYYNVNTVTFTLAGPAPEPEGASSVLFLPGIQASRLFKDGIGGIEDQIWEPNSNQDVGQLEMTESGESVNQIYTKENEVMQEIAFPTLGTNVYKSFAILLNTLDSTEVIQDWTPFAYDWRFDVNDVSTKGVSYKNEIKNLVSEIENLASSSYTGKVTIIGHSNGGLVGKMLISELDRQGKADLVDKLVMIGTPQLGAPKAILAMLHGYDQQALGGLLISSGNARTVMRNMPGVYGLLPSAEYFDKSPGVMISADTSNTTASIRAYNQINSKTSLDNFLTDSLNQRTDNVPINEPLTLNNTVLQGSSATKQKLDSWLPPQGVEVYEVVGTGNATVKGFEYQAFPCTFGFLTCPTGSYMKAVPIITSNGDETVPVVSAAGQDGDKVTGYIDLYKEGLGVLNNKRTHLDITESDIVQNFIKSIIKFRYINETLEIPDYVEVVRNFKLIGIHSPVSLSLTDNLGKQTGLINGEIKEEIPGSEYFELGDSSYVIIPDDVLFNAEINGQATGTYSITIDTLKNDSQTNTFRYIGASTTPTLKANFTFATSGFTSIKTDTNGDGTTDLEQTLNGQAILPPVVSSYSLLKTNIKGLKLAKLLETVLLLQVDVAIYWDNLRPVKPTYQKLEFAALDSLKATLLVYRQKKFITQAQYSTLEIIINNLRK